MLSRRALLALAALAAPSAAALTACQSSDATDAPRDQANAEAEPSTSSTFAFDTYCTFTVYGDATAPALLARECARYDELFDLYDPASDIARVNAAASAPVTVDPATAEVVEQALAFCAEAGGLFDITIGAVSQLWDFAEGVRPSDAEIAAALALGIGNTELRTLWMAYRTKPFSNPVFNEARRMGLAASKLSGGKISYGAGKYASAENNLVRLQRSTVAQAMRLSDWEIFSRKGAVGYYVGRGSSYPCSLCDSMVGFHHIIDITQMPPYHANCVCWYYPVYA